MKRSLLLGIWILAIGFSYAETRKSIRKPDPLSYFYDILDVHEARTTNVVARVYDVPAHRDSAVTTQVLQVVADNRPPNVQKTSVGRNWNIGQKFKRVDAVTVEDATVVIHGWTYDRGPVVCTLLLQFKDGVLTESLDDRGCK